MSKIILWVFFFIVSSSTIAQTVFTNDPDSAIFLTSDISLFWNAFEAFKKDSTINPFGAKYIDVGSNGVKGFIPNRIQNAEHLFSTVKISRIS